MTTPIIRSRVQMEPVMLQQLVAEVKETIATTLHITGADKSASFKAIDLWNIQRRGRYANSSSKRKLKTALSLTHVSF
ncbi:MAG: hypothetical protein ABIQ88_17115 [Chitinophagaceae bacterium]